MTGIVERLRQMGPYINAEELDAAADRIEALEEALREIAETFAVGKAMKIARAALEPEK
jgi:hypothetical protein